MKDIGLIVDAASRARAPRAWRLGLRGIACTLALAGVAATAEEGAAERTKKLVDVLTSEADVFSKARACQQAGEWGSAEAVPALAGLLTDEKLSAYARSGLENIAAPSAAAALRAALGKLEGARLSGVVSSLGVIRDAQAVEALRELAGDPGKGVVKEALLALGRIGDTASREALQKLLRSSPAAARADVASGLLLAAERQVELGQAEEAQKIYDELRGRSELPAVIRTAATCGAIRARKKEGLAFLMEQFLSRDAAVRLAAQQCAYDFPPKELALALDGAMDAASGEAPAWLQNTRDAVCFTPLFNGKNFLGWEGDTTNSFRIERGVIIGGTMSAKIPRNEFLTTVRPYTNFILRVACKLQGTCNAGIQIRSQRIPNHHEMIGYQADMSTGANGGYWGKLYDESRRNKLLGQDENRAQMLEALKPNDWNQYEIRCQGRRIQLFVNGVRTMDYTETDQAIPQFGVIGLQIHSGPPSEAAYRSVMIAELP